LNPIALRIVIGLISAIVLFSDGGAAYAQVPSFDFEDPQKKPPFTSSDGTFTLEWNQKTPENGPAYEVQQDPPDGEPFIVTVGKASKTVISGMAEGEHVFRLRTISDDGHSEWSQPVTVTSKYPETWLVNTLLILGGIVVLATIGGIVHGFLTTRDSSDEASPR
jgi:hypothetical protein